MTEHHRTSSLPMPGSQAHAERSAVTDYGLLLERLERVDALTKAARAFLRAENVDPQDRTAATLLEMLERELDEATKLVLVHEEWRRSTLMLRDGKHGAA